MSIDKYFAKHGEARREREEAAEAKRLMREAEDKRTQELLAAVVKPVLDEVSEAICRSYGKRRQELYKLAADADG